MTKVFGVSHRAVVSLEEVIEAATDVSHRDTALAGGVTEWYSGETAA